MIYSDRLMIHHLVLAVGFEVLIVAVGKAIRVALPEPLVLWQNLDRIRCKSPVFVRLGNFHRMEQPLYPHSDHLSRVRVALVQHPKYLLIHQISLDL